ncbi:hypothetical protein [Dyella nitratireducens]|uniref:Uncharacterized protein n=1 Tax=Dyella nitratireducens TaxID=1849580 RepID=A0ABQ1FP46_9GAMM|nr:hypothetical protein [Dyella nitratireducens]GGA23262.1 hypothetical protein GCM10010981_09460 [Dyella nitratireducens]GLQ43992.1 hypothetical protein GCM10007902_38420 [Dyella nitratireducens]
MAFIQARLCWGSHPNLQLLTVASQEKPCAVSVVRLRRGKLTKHYALDAFWALAPPLEFEPPNKLIIDWAAELMSEVIGLL